MASTPYIKSLVADLKSMVDSSDGLNASSTAAALGVARRVTEALENPQHAVSQHFLTVTSSLVLPYHMLRGSLMPRISFLLPNTGLTSSLNERC